MKRFYNSDDYFLVQDIISQEIFAVLSLYKVKFNAGNNDGLFPCYQFSAMGLVVEGIRNFIPQNQLFLFDDSLVSVLR